MSIILVNINKNHLLNQGSEDILIYFDRFRGVSTDILPNTAPAGGHTIGRIAPEPFFLL